MIAAIGLLAGGDGQCSWEGPSVIGGIVTGWLRDTVGQHVSSGGGW